MFEGPGGSGRDSRALVIGAALTALWLVMLLVFWLTGSSAASGAPRWISVVAALMPLGLEGLALAEEAGGRDAALHYYRSDPDGV